MAVHAAFGGSTNLLLHIPAIAFAAGLPRPTRRRLARGQPAGPPAGQRPAQRPALSPDGPRLPGRRRPRGDAPPPGARACSTRSVLTVDRRAAGARRSTGGQASERRKRLRERLFEEDGVDPDDVIMSPGAGRGAGADQHGHVPAGQPRARRARSSRARRSTRPSSTPTASIARPARRGSSPASATRSPPSRGRATDPIKPGDVLVLIGRGPMGAGMEEIYQITAGAASTCPSASRSPC